MTKTIVIAKKNKPDTQDTQDTQNNHDNWQYQYIREPRFKTSNDTNKDDLLKIINFIY